MRTLPLLLFLVFDSNGQKVVFDPDRAAPISPGSFGDILSMALDSQAINAQFDEAVKILDHENSSGSEEKIPEPSRRTPVTVKRRTSDDEDDSKELERIVDVFGKASSILGSLLGEERSNMMLPRISVHGSSGDGSLKDDKTINLLDKITSIPMKITADDVSIDKNCLRFPDAFVCVSKTMTKNGGKETRRIQECCKGYTTTNIFEEGCDQEVSSHFSDKQLESLNLTVVPNGNVIVSDGKSYQLENTEEDVYEWSDQQILKSVSDELFVVKQSHGYDGFTKFNLNCQPVKSLIKRPSGTILQLDEVKPAANNLLQLAKDIPQISTFLYVLGEDLREYLSVTNEATIFAFSNEAFESLPNRTKEQIRERSMCVPDLMKQHIVTTGAFCAAEFPVQMDTLYGNRMTFTNHRGQLKVGGANVVVTNSYALNGVIHVIDQVLVTENFLSWRDTLSQYNPQLEEALSKSNFTTPITILVPEQNTTDVRGLPTRLQTAFQFSETPATNYIISGKLIRQFNTPQHVRTDANSTFFTGVSSTSSPFQMRVSFRGSDFTEKGRVACSRVTKSPVYACQAVLHFLDKPLPMINETLIQLLDHRPDLSRFSRIWKASNASQDLEERDTPMTLFIPSDDAFSTNQFKKMLKNADTYVKNHIVKDTLCDFDLTRKKYEIRKSIYATLGAQMISPETIDEENFVNGARIQESEIILSDAIVYILESQMEPPKKKVSNEKSPGFQPNPFDILSRVLPFALRG